MLDDHLAAERQALVEVGHVRIDQAKAAEHHRLSDRPGDVGAVLVESYTVPGMAHGAPPASGPGADHVGSAGAFFLDVGISSSFHIAKFWGLVGHPHMAAVDQIALAPAPAERLHGEEAQLHKPIDAEPRERDVHSRPFDVQAVITNALKAAGLMK